MSKHRYIVPYLIPGVLFGILYLILQGSNRLFFAFLVSGLLLLAVNSIILMFQGGNYGQGKFSSFDTNSLVASHEENVKDFMNANPQNAVSSFEKGLPFYFRYPYVTAIFGAIFIIVAFVVY